MKPNVRVFRGLWVARVLIGAVLFFNVQCALLFIAQPEAYAAGFELEGAAGAAAVRGFGILFLMWNVPYAVALWHPRRQRVSLWQALIMQAIGVIGESLLLGGLPAGFQALRASIWRFILFDAGGLIFLLIALLLTRQREGG